MIRTAKALAEAHVVTPEIVSELTRAFDRKDDARMRCLLQAMTLTIGLLEAILKAARAETKAMQDQAATATKPILRVVE